MNPLYLVLLKFIPVLFMILLGKLMRRWGVVQPDTIRDFKKIIIQFSLPALLFLTFAKTTFQLSYLLIFAAIFIVCLFLLVLGTRCSKLLKSDNRYLPSVFSGFETGMLGYALYSAFYGAENTYKLAVFDIGQVIFVFFVLVGYLQKQNGEDTSAGRLFSNFIRSPVILAIFLGVLFGSTGLTSLVQQFQLTDSAVTALELLGNLTEPLICIIIGYELQIRRKYLVKPLLTALLRMLLLTAAAFLLNVFLIERVLHLDRSFEVALYTMFLLPPPFVIPIYIDQKAENDRQYILNVISIHIVLTLAAFLILVTLTA